MPGERAEERLGDRVRELREARGWSQRELANRMQRMGFNWFQSTVQKTEVAGRPVRVDEAAALSELLEVKVDDLITADPGPFFQRLERLLANLAAAREDVGTRASELAAKRAALADAEARVERLHRKVRALDPFVNYISSDRYVDPEPVPLLELKEEEVREIVGAFGADDEWRAVLAEAPHLDQQAFLSVAEHLSQADQGD